MSDLRLHVQHLSHQYGRRTVLDDISFDAGPGVTALVGANGAGKTTLLRLVAGVLTPRIGTVELRGLDGARPRIGLLPQGPTPTALLSARGYVEYFAYLAGLPRRQALAASMAALDVVGLADQATTRTSRLSGGMFRRVALAAALVGDPHVLLLDEPTTGLDPVQRVRFRDLVARIAADRLVLVATHLMEDVAAVADQLVVLDASRMVFTGSPAELARRGDCAAAGAPDLENAVVSMFGTGR